VVGSAAAAQTVTVTNSGTTSATVTSVTVTGDFSQTNHCTSIAVGRSCAVTVTFKPTASGAAAGAAHGVPYDPGHAYTFGLQRVIDGLGALIDTSGT